MVDIFSAMGIWRFHNRPSFGDKYSSKSKRKKSKSLKSREKPKEVQLSPKVPRIRRLSEVSDDENDDPTPVSESHETIKEWHDDGEGCCEPQPSSQSGRKRVISFSDYVTVHRYI
uniref:uncharacterized protein LOC120340566 n=1 Tax=Styela clava TaxID=7725 RepID=UPI001939AC7F|nr:uncharacterized protein LOC120340566 [Styela clava]